MIKANVILGHSKWKKKIKNPSNYFKNKLIKLSKIPFFRRKKQEFSILLTNNKKMKNLNEISVVDFNHNDVVRHPLVTKIVKAYDDIEK